MKHAIKSAATVLLMSTYTATASTCTNPTVQRGVPLHSGHVAFDSQDGHLYIYDLRQRTLDNISDGWSISLPLNPDYSSDGNWITFTATTSDGLAKHLYAWNTSSRQLSDLTPDATVPEEDPKFSFDQNYMVFKDNGNIAAMTLSYENGTITPGEMFDLTTDGVRGTPTEASAPTMSAKNNRIFFFRGVSPPDPPVSRRVFPGEHVQELFVDLTTMTVTKLKEVPQPIWSESYYPILSPSDDLYFARHHLSQNNEPGKDRIFFAAHSESLHKLQPTTSNVCSGDNSDPAPVDAGHYFFSLSRHKKPYILVLADLSGNVWLFRKDEAISSLTSSLEGASYSPK